MKEYFEEISQRFKAEFATAKGWISNILDVLIIAVLLYFLFVFLRKHNCKRLIKVAITFVTVFALLLSSFFDNKMLQSLAFAGFVFLLIAFVLLFPQEVKRTLWKMSSSKEDSKVFLTDYNCSDEELKITIDEIVRAAQNMSKKNVGALMIIAPHEIPHNILESGVRLDSVLSGQLLECIFNTKAPLHDGAVFIRGNRIIASGCFLPLTQSLDIDKELGTRHRAAIGVTETNNMLAIIVSEETGIISTAMNGSITRYYDSQMLHEKLEQVYGLRAIENQKMRRKRRER